MKQIVVILIIAGLYFLLDHKYPLPFNHEEIGLGTNHIVHSIFGIVLFVVAGFVWWKGRSKRKR